jgi:hypothetical protein
MGFLLESPVQLADSQLPHLSTPRGALHCKTKLYAADGKTTELESKAGTATALPVIASHSAENTGNADCTQIFFEKK